MPGANRGSCAPGIRFGADFGDYQSIPGCATNDDDYVLIADVYNTDQLDEDTMSFLQKYR